MQVNSALLLQNTDHPLSCDAPVQNYIVRNLDISLIEFIHHFDRSLVENLVFFSSFLASLSLEISAWGSIMMDHESICFHFNNSSIKKDQGPLFMTLIRDSKHLPQMSFTALVHIKRPPQKNLFIYIGPDHLCLL